MKEPLALSLLAAAPAVGPAIITVFGIDVPVLAFGLSVAGLLFARTLAPPSLRKLDKRQEWALTLLLLIITFLVVTGELGNGEPMGGGLAVIWGVGLGFSGLMVIEFFGDRVMAMLRAGFGGAEKMPHPPAAPIELPDRSASPPPPTATEGNRNDQPDDDPILPHD